MKRFPLFVLALLVLLLAACAPAEPVQSSIAVQLPDVVKLAIEVALVALLTAGAVWLFEMLGLDLRGFATPVAMAFAAFVVTELQNIINAIPEQYDVYLDFALKVIVLLLGSIGFFRLRKPAESHKLL